MLEDPWFVSLPEEGNFSLLQIIQPNFPWVPAFFQTVNLPGFDFDHPVHLVSRLRMGGATSLFPLYAIVTCTEAVVPCVIYL